MKLNKNIFLINHECVFSFNLIMNMVVKKIIDIDKTLIVFYGEHGKNNLKEKFCDKGFESLEWIVFKSGYVGDYKTLNTISLNPCNAKLIIECLETGLISSDIINIIITDDEVDRWNKLYNKKKRLVVCNKSQIDTNVIKVLRSVNNYICPVNPLGYILESILDRKLNIIDAIVPITIVSYIDQKVFNVEVNKSRIHDEKFVLIQTKPWPRRDKIFWYFALFYFVLRYKDREKINFGIWINEGGIDLFLLKIIKFLVFIKCKNIYFKIMRKLQPSDYFKKIHEFDCLILQGRGGFSTAKYFAEEVGNVIIQRDTINYQIFKNSYDIGFAGTSGFYESLILSIECNRNNDFLVLSELIKDKHNMSIVTLSKFYK